jgi:DNA-binding response OmpR family regulator
MGIDITGNQEKDEHSISGLDLDKLDTDRPKILVIDDEPMTCDLLKMLFIKEGMDVLSALDGYEALRKAASYQPDVILLDLMMPGLDGWDTYSKLREISHVPVLILSAIQTKDEIVRGLNLGADDYITKPFHPQELVERVRRSINRSEVPAELPLINFPQTQLRIFPASFEVLYQGKMVGLPRKAFELLELLAHHAPRVISSEMIGNHMWGEFNTSIRNRIKYLVYQLRQNLEDDPEYPKLIISRGKQGYRLEAS